MQNYVKLEIEGPKQQQDDWNVLIESPTSHLGVPPLVRDYSERVVGSDRLTLSVDDTRTTHTR